MLCAVPLTIGVHEPRRLARLFARRTARRCTALRRTPPFKQISNERPQDKSWSCKTMEEEGEREEEAMDEEEAMVEQVAMEWEEEAMEWEEEEAKEEAKEEEGALLPKPMGAPGLTADIGLG